MPLMSWDVDTARVSATKKRSLPLRKMVRSVSRLWKFWTNARLRWPSQVVKKLWRMKASARAGEEGL